MAVMSFAHLKNKKTEEKPSPEIIHKKKEPVSREIKSPGKVQTFSFHESGSLEGIDINTPILISRFCYGCVQFSVDAPMTEKERAYCLRKGENGDDYEFIFKRIKPSIVIGQCPIVKKVKGRK